MLRDDINTAVKEAMKAKDERKLSTLRMVNSTIKNADIAARGEGKPPLSDADLLGVFQKMIKQRQESVELYDKGGRSELAAQEREEIAIISAYLPKQMSDDDVKAAISAIIAETNAAGVTKTCCWCVRDRRFSRSTPIAATIMVRSPTASSMARAFAARGIMPVSICEPGKPRALRRSMRSRSGRSSAKAIALSFAKSANSPSPS